MDDEKELKKRKSLLDEFDKLKDKLNDLADVDEDSDIPVTEKKAKEKRWIE